MSDTYLKLISIVPGFVPDKLKERKAREFLNNSFKNWEIEFINTDEIEFIDQGANFETVKCNYCGKEINTEIWQNATDESYNTGFKDLSFVTPRCHESTTLNDLKYEWPAGFAKFAMLISNPLVDTNDGAVNELETILGTKIRKIWAYY